MDVCIFSGGLHPELKGDFQKNTSQGNLNFLIQKRVELYYAEFFWVGNDQDSESYFTFDFIMIYISLGK